jgi:hypothetical protein
VRVIGELSHEGRRTYSCSKHENGGPFWLDWVVCIDSLKMKFKGMIWRDEEEG